MISYEQACQSIQHHAIALKKDLLPCLQALHKTLAEDVIAPCSLPHFDNSAVDGYALHTSSLTQSKRLAVMASIRAQAQTQIMLKAHTALKIMTGAPLPVGADAVVMKEQVTADRDEIHINGTVLPADHIRRCGEDCKQGDVVAHAGERVTPQLIGALLALGITAIWVMRPPKIRIISTGDELVMPGTALKWGEVYYLTGPMLVAQAYEMGVSDISFQVVKDDASAISSAIKEHLDCDILLLTGGMSQGDHDFVRSALFNNGVEQIFYQGAFRPGKPLFFGRKEETRIFGLPGNPVAVFVSFQVFVRELIAASLQAKTGEKRWVVLQEDIVKKPGFTYFMRASIHENNQVSLLPGQGSHQIISLAHASGLIIAPAHQSLVKAGELVQYLAF